MRKLWLNLAFPFILLMSATICGADDVSLRIKALGSGLAGIITDIETDILQNPARLAELDSIRLFSTFNPSSSGIGRHKYIGDYTGDNTLYSAGLFPRVISPNVGIGFVICGSHRKTFYGYYYPERLTEAYYDELHKNQRWYDHNEFSTDYRSTIFNSIRLSQKASIGFSYSYSTSSYDQFWNRYYQSHTLDLYTLDTLYVHKDSWEDNAANNSNAHMLRVGSMFKFGDKTYLEAIGEIVISREDSLCFETDIYSYFREREHYYYYSDSSYHYDYDNESRHDENSEQSKSILDSRIYSLGFRLAQRISQHTKLHLIASMGVGRGTLSGDTERDIISISEDYFSSTHYSPETTYTRVLRYDTLHSRIQESGIVSGNKNFFISSVTIGVEIRISEDALLGLALKGIWGRDEVDKREVVSQSVRVDTAGSPSTTIDTTYTVVGKIKKTSKYFFVPVGIEYKLTPSISLRYGICPEINLESHETEGEVDYSVSYTEGLKPGFFFGLGYRLSDKLSFDLFNNGDLTNLSSWEVEARLFF